MSDDLIRDADAKLAQNEIELLGCYDVHPEPYENDAEAPAARRAFLEDLLAPFLACIDALAAEDAALSEACAKWAEVSQGNYQRAKEAEKLLATCLQYLRGQKPETMSGGYLNSDIRKGITTLAQQEGAKG